MTIFEVILSDGSTRILQAQNKGLLRDALSGAGLNATSVKRLRRCTLCHKEAATVQQTLCNPCWQEAISTCREAWSDLALSEQELHSLVMSFFVVGG